MPRRLDKNLPYSIYINGTDGAANNALSCAFSASLNPTAACTVSTFFFPVGPRKAFVLADNSLAGTTNSYWIRVNANGSTDYFCTIGGVAKNITGATSVRVKWNEWNLLEWTFSGTAINMFLNGSQLTEQFTGLSGALGTNTGETRFGAYYSGGLSLTMLGYLYKPQVLNTSIVLADHVRHWSNFAYSSSFAANVKLDPAMTEGSGSTTADLSGNSNTMTLGASASWSTFSPSKARTTITNRTDIGVDVAASGEITVTDYEFLVGKNSTATLTVTDWTAMAGGTLDLFSGSIVVVEGVDFTAATSNDATATAFAAAIDTAAGDPITAVVGAVITMTVPGANNGGAVTWDMGGLTPTSTSFSGGFDRTNLNIGNSSGEFRDIGPIVIGVNNDGTATNIATWINSSAENAFVSAAAVGSVVTVTYLTTGPAGNAYTMSVTGFEGGTPSGGVTLSGGTLTGGNTGRATITNRTIIS